MERLHRVSDTLKEAIAEVILYEVADPRLTTVNITTAQISRDKRRLTVFFLVYGDAAKEKEVLDCLARAGSFIRRRLAQRVPMKYVPEIAFKVDDLMKSERHIDELLSPKPEEHAEST